MTSPSPCEPQSQFVRRLENFYDVVARLLAKRWLREQQIADPHRESDSTPTIHDRLKETHPG